MTRDEFWNALDALCASPDRADALTRLSDLLQTASRDELPIVIACTRTPGRIHHSYTMFDASNPDLSGNRYLICFTGPEQAHLPSPASSVNDPADQDLTLEERFRLIDEAAASTAPDEDEAMLSLEERFRLIDEGSQPEKKAKPRRRRRKATTSSPLWTTNDASETATVSAKVVLDYMKRNRKVGGLIFDIYDGKRGVTLPKFMIG